MVPPARDTLDPALRARLLQEARTPWRGLRRGLWLAFTASAGVGLAAIAREALGIPKAAGYLLFAVGMLNFLLLPVYLSKRWKSKPDL